MEIPKTSSTPSLDRGMWDNYWEIAKDSEASWDQKQPWKQVPEQKLLKETFVHILKKGNGRYLAPGKRKREYLKDVLWFDKTKSPTTSYP